MQNAGPTPLALCSQVVVAEAEVETRWSMADGYSAAAEKSLEL